MEPLWWWLAACGVVGGIVIALLLWNSTTIRKTKPPLNIIKGIEFPDPLDPRWRRIGLNNFAFGSYIQAWTAWPIFATLTAFHKSFFAPRYVRAVVRAQNRRYDQLVKDQVRALVQQG